jgi:hypothetical protein
MLTTPQDVPLMPWPVLRGWIARTPGRAAGTPHYESYQNPSAPTGLPNR